MDQSLRYLPNNFVLKYDGKILLLENMYIKELKEKVGASELEFTKKSDKKSKFESKARIKDKEFRIIICVR